MESSKMLTFSSDIVMQFISKSEVGEITLTHILKTAGVKELKFLVSPYLGSKIK